MHYRLFYAFLTASIVMALVAGCQGSNDIVQEGPGLAPATDLKPGTGVDPELWAKLTSELDQVLKQEGTARRTAAGPIGKGSQVPDLSVRGGGSGTLYEWTYRNQGDYDLNGVVNISDLTQVGLHFEKDTLSPDWQQAQLADGDNNGVVNIADVTPIGQNFGGEVDGYEFQTAPGGPGTEFTAVQDYPFIAGDKTTGLYPEYVRDTLPTLSGPAYRVVPYVDNGGGREYGIASNVYDSTVSGRNNWYTHRGNFLRDSLAHGEGPTDVGSTWETELEGRILFQEPVCDYMGTIYIGTAVGETIDDTSTGYFYALDQDGNILWRYHTFGAIAMTAATNAQGRIAFGDASGMIYCLARDGKQLWRRQLSGWAVYSGALLDQNGNVFLLTQTITGGSISGSTLFRLMADGSVAWSRATNDSCFSAPFYNFDFQITVVDNAGEVYAYAYDGSLIYNFVLPVQPDSTLFSTTIVSHGVALVYADNADNLRVHAYDNSFTAAVPLGEDPITAIALNTLNDVIIGTKTAGPDPSVLLNYYQSGAELWDIVLNGDYTTNICVDQTDRMYLSSLYIDAPVPGLDNTISCILPDQTISWVYPTGSKLSFSPVVVDDNLLVCTLLTSLVSSADANSSLLGIRGI